MKLIVVIVGYLKWHYSKAVRSVVSVWKNFLDFLVEFFSLKYLLRNLLDPWKRMNDNYPSRFSLKDYAFAFITNIIMRIVGIIMRLLLLVVTIISCIIFVIILPLAIFIWAVLPLIILFLLISGLYLIFT
jgi:hypothetical protein